MFRRDENAVSPAAREATDVIRIPYAILSRCFPNGSVVSTRTLRCAKASTSCQQQSSHVRVLTLS